jgi:hypothetical protein
MSWQGHRKPIRRQRNNLGLAIDGRQQPDQQQRTEHLESIWSSPDFVDRSQSFTETIVGVAARHCS